MLRPCPRHGARSTLQIRPRKTRGPDHVRPLQRGGPAQQGDGWLPGWPIGPPPCTGPPSALPSRTVATSQAQFVLPLQHPKSGPLQLQPRRGPRRYHAVATNASSTTRLPRPGHGTPPEGHGGMLPPTSTRCGAHPGAASTPRPHPPRSQEKRTQRDGPGCSSLVGPARAACPSASRCPQSGPRPGRPCEYRTRSPTRPPGS
mmetsp:Transcript_12671/g.30290  ORF Transcript_12671/g.30290 Transcript_12671/m.30290 type:complete len:202 (+) Transcript_12671:35-640(+)